MTKKPPIDQFAMFVKVIKKSITGAAIGFLFVGGSFGAENQQTVIGTSVIQIPAGSLSRIVVDFNPKVTTPSGTRQLDDTPVAAGNIIGGSNNWTRLAGYFIAGPAEIEVRKFATYSIMGAEGFQTRLFQAPVKLNSFDISPTEAPSLVLRDGEALQMLWAGQAVIRAYNDSGEATVRFLLYREGGVPVPNEIAGPLNLHVDGFLTYRIIQKSAEPKLLIQRSTDALNWETIREDRIQALPQEFFRFQLQKPSRR